MQKALLVIFLLSTWIGSAIAEPGKPSRPSGNLLTNGDFDLGNFTGWYDIYPEPWPYGGINGSNYGSDSRVTAPPELRETDDQLSALVLGSPDGIIVPNIFQRMPARPGDTFDLSGWIYSETDMNPQSFSLLKIVFEDAQGFHLEPAEYLDGEPCPCFPWVGVESEYVDWNSEPRVWHERTARGTAPEGTVRVIFFALNVDFGQFAFGPSRIWFDDLAVSVFPEDYSEQRLVDVQTILGALNPDQPKLKSLVNWADQMFKMSRNDNISGAVALLDRILIRVDGCFYRGVPDKKGSSADWVDDCEIQVPLTQNLLLARDAMIQK